MLLIADGGSTKTSWSLIDEDNPVIAFETEGYHPFFVDSEYITHSLETCLTDDIRKTAKKIHKIFFYSAGGGYSIASDNVIVEGLSRIFSNAGIRIETDLLGAARALLQDKEGMAAILGTGSNSCLYDGEKITHNIESLGFVLGDEGSGAYMGKKIIGDYIRGYMPPEVKEEFADHCKMTADELIDQIYTQPMPNKFCAGFCRFIGKNIDKHEYYPKIVYDSFEDLFKNIISGYPDYKKYSFNCVGSIAFHFQSILAKVVKKNGMILGNILQYPMEGLINYHQNKK